jgi:hypothetical protein
MGGMGETWWGWEKHDGGGWSRLALGDNGWDVWNMLYSANPVSEGYPWILIHYIVGVSLGAHIVLYQVYPWVLVSCSWEAPLGCAIRC